MIKKLLIIFFVNFIIFGNEINVNFNSYHYRQYLDFYCQETGTCLFKKKDDVWWLVFDKKFENLKIPAIFGNGKTGKTTVKLIEDSVSSSNHTALEIVVDNGSVPLITKEKDFWRLTIIPKFHDEEIKKKPLIKFENNFISINAEDDCKELFIEDPVSKKKFYLITTKTNSQFFDFDSQKNKNHYSVISTVQGFCCFFRTDYITTFMQNNLIKLQLNFSHFINFDNAIKPINRNNNLIFVQGNKSIDLENYKKKLDDKIRFSKTKCIDDRVEQIWLNIALNQPEEAISGLLFLGKNYPILSENNTYQALLACSYLIQGNYELSRNILNLLPKLDELMFWKILSENMMGAKKGFSDDVHKIVLRYPSKLRDKIMSILLPKIYQNSQYDLLEKFFAEPINSIGIEYQSLFDFYKAKILQLKKQDMFEVENIYKRISSDSKAHISIQTEANYELLMINAVRKTDEEIINNLEKLRLMWRGDHLELKITLKLIEYLKKNKKYERILEIVKALSINYKNDPDFEKMPKILEDVFIDYFNQDISLISPLENITIFNNFGNYISDKDKYDKILDKIIDEYIKVDLLSEAISLLEKKLNSINDKKLRSEIFKKILRLNVENESYDHALKVMENMQKENDPESYSEIIKEFQVKIFLNTNKELQAVELLKKDPSAYDYHFLGTIYEKNENNYEKALESFEKSLSILEKKAQPLDEKETRVKIDNILNLANLYYLKEKNEGLEKLNKLYKKFMIDNVKDSNSLNLFLMLINQDPVRLNFSEDTRKVLQSVEELQKNFEEVAKKIPDLSDDVVRNNNI